MKKNLIYFICHGEFAWREMVKLSILSILDYSDFEGDIIVLSDSTGIPQDVRFINERIQVIDIFKNRPDLNNKISNKFNIYCVKSMLNQFVDISEYNYILYLDGDCLVNLKNFDGLLNFWASQNIIQISGHEGWDISKNRPSTGSQFLSLEESKKWHNYGFCAGVLGFPGNQLGQDLLNDWFAYNSQHSFEYDDQGALTALLLRKYSDKYELCRYCNENRWLLKDINHYHGGHKKLFWEHCKILIKKYQHFIDLNGVWEMSKPIEGIINQWEFKDGLVFVNNPQITGTLQCSRVGNYVWWQCFEGFEKLKPLDSQTILGDSFKGGEDCFLLTKD